MDMLLANSRGIVQARRLRRSQEYAPFENPSTRYVSRLRRDHARKRGFWGYGLVIGLFGRLACGRPTGTTRRDPQLLARRLRAELVEA